MGRARKEEPAESETRQGTRGKGTPKGQGGYYWSDSRQAWIVQLRVKKPDGSTSPVRRIVRAPQSNDRPARAKLRELQNARDADELAAVQPMTVKQFLEKWLADAIKPHTRPRTFLTYRGVVENHLVPALGPRQLSSLSSQHIQQYVNDAINAGKLAPTSIRYHYKILKQALAQAIEWEYLKRNPAMRMRLPQSVAVEIQPFSTEQVAALLAGMAGHRYEVLYHLALGLGMRRGEILALRWSDIDFDRGILKVRRTLQSLNGIAHEGDVKTRAGRRDLRLPLNLVATLHRHRERQDAEKAPEWPENDYVLRTKHGTPMLPTTLDRHFNYTLRRLSLPHHRFHDLRHTWVTLMFNRGVQITTIAKWAGHSSPAITLRVYAHVLPEQEDSAVAASEDILRLKPKGEAE